MKKYDLFTALAMTLICVSSAAAIGIGYEAGTMRVRSALTVPKGNIYLGGHSRAFFKDEVANSSQGLSSGVTYWDIQGGMGLRYGFTSKLELGITQIVYQDNQKGGKGYNLPDDLYLSAKLGNIGPKASIFRAGMQADLHLPTAEFHNLPLEPYSSGRISIGLMGIISLVSQPLYPDAGVQVNLNAGIYNHNDLGVTLTILPQDTLIARKDTREFVYGLSFSKLRQDFGFFAELYGRSFLQKPPLSAFTRENSLYISPGISYAPNPWLRLKVGLDLRLVGSKDETAYNGEGGSFAVKSWKTVPNLPTWQINVGAAIVLHAAKKAAAPLQAPAGEQFITSGSTSTNEKLYQNLADSRQETENAEAELERIRSERQRMEDLLQRLRRILDWPASGTQQQPEEKPKEEKPKQE